MAMNSSGPISLGGATAGQSINLENGFSATAQVSLNDTAVRNLAGVASGAITMPTNFYGKANRVSISYTFSSNTANASLNLSALGGYSAGKTDFTVTVGSGVYVYSTSTGSYGLNLSGATTGDTVTLVNNGFIAGMGGAGRAGTYQSGDPGGPALNIGTGIGITINNTNPSAYIGGGGGSGGASNGFNNSVGSGGGAGGGNGGTTAGPAVSGGGPGSAGADGTTNYVSGGGGGRIFPGVGGVGGISYSTTNGKGGGAGGGGAAGYGFAKGGPSKTGGGGGWGASGGTGYTEGGAGTGGSGGSGNAAGGSGSPAGYAPYGGGSGGKAVNLNGKTVTWTSGNTTRVYGAIS